jgi:spore coat polysaccharide biosynthesis predicted glycosyltransferase SpsG
VDAQCIIPVVVRSRSLANGVAVARALQRFAASVWLERVDAATLAGWAGSCQCAVSACGGALNELAYLGLPFVGVVVAENQRPLAREVEARWHLPIVDADQDDFRANIAAAVRRLIASPAMARPSFGGIDGHGAARVADVIEGWRD